MAAPVVKPSGLAGWDVIDGGDGDDLIHGGNGRDIITGGKGSMSSATSAGTPTRISAMAPQT